MQNANELSPVLRWTCLHRVAILLHSRLQECKPKQIDSLIWISLSL